MHAWLPTFPEVRKSFEFLFDNAPYQTNALANTGHVPSVVLSTKNADYTDKCQYLYPGA